MKAKNIILFVMLWYGVPLVFSVLLAGLAALLLAK